MFTIECPRHGSKVLVFEPRIRHLENTASGIVLDVECWCGEHVTVRTGRAAGESVRWRPASPTEKRT